MIIVDLDFPSCCDDCNFFDDSGDYPTCLAIQLSSGYNFDHRHTRMKLCPIVGETESKSWNHGRLIDESDAIDAVIKRVMELSKNQEYKIHDSVDVLGVIPYILTAPTAIESNDE